MLSAPSGGFGGVAVLCQGAALALGGAGGAGDVYKRQTQNSTENVNETDGMTLLDSVFDTLSEGTDVTITLEQEGVRQSYPNTLDTYWAMRMPTSENFNWCGITKEDYSAASSEGEGKQNRLSLSGSKDGEQLSLIHI